LIGFGLDPDKLAQLGITPEKIVNTYRDLHPALAGKWTTALAKAGREDRSFRSGGIWKDIDYAIKIIARSSDGAKITRCKCIFTKYKGHMFIELPSGTRLMYRNVRMGFKTPPWGGDKIEVVLFDSYKNGRMVTDSTYGGKVFENITQGFTRDVLAFLMVVARGTLGLVPSLHVHDEVLWEIPLGAKELFYKLLRLMSTPPPFCQTYPLACEGFISPIYRKSPSKDKKLGQKEFTAVLGKVLGVD